MGDATVPRAPSKASEHETVDPITGELRNHRVDPAVRDYYENGEKAKRPVRGTKWFFGSGRGEGYWTRVILTFAHVAGGEYENEAAVAVRQFSWLKTALPDRMGVIYDGALRGVHRGALARRGLLVVNRQHGSVNPSSTNASNPAATATTCGATRAASPRASASTTAPACSNPYRSHAWSPVSVSPRAGGTTC